MTFESDLTSLREAVLSAPSREMRMRHQRRTDSSASTVQALVGDRSTQYQVVALYEMPATKGSKPTVVVEVDPSADLSQIAQGAVVTVRGWPVVGRAVVLDIAGTVVEPTYPCTSPVFRPMRFK